MGIFNFATGGIVPKDIIEKAMHTADHNAMHRIQKEAILNKAKIDVQEKIINRLTDSLSHQAMLIDMLYEHFGLNVEEVEAVEAGYKIVKAE